MAMRFFSPIDLRGQIHYAGKQCNIEEEKEVYETICYVSARTYSFANGMWSVRPTRS
ncbi:hypothetical protein YSY22_23530 [Brevibacillus formosus]